MFFSPFLICLGFYKYSLGSAANTDSGDNVIDLGYAKYLGNHTTTWPNTVSYLGIPYAEPPIGDRRFRATLPLNTTRIAEEGKGEVIDARSYPDFCIQTRDNHEAAGNEDCLKVNVYTPVGIHPSAELPVLVYIHGGGYVSMNPAHRPFEHWIQQSPNVIVVVVYYRLSGFGFLAIPEFANGQLGDLNAGFLDQIEALRWVQKYISKFGGDPNQVTINGLSAGGSSVELHLVASEGEEGLFRGVIAQSVWRVPLPMPEQQQPLFDAFVQKAGCASGTLTDQMSCLRSASASVLAVAQDNVTATLSGYHDFRPVVDNKVLTDFPTKLIESGKFRRVPLIVGTTTNESGVKDSISAAAAAQAFFPSLSDEGVSELLAAYPSSAFASDKLRQHKILDDYAFSCAGEIMASSWVNAQVNAWTYRYNQPVPNSGTSATVHSAENYMMFRGIHNVNGISTFSTLNPSETAFSEELIAYWLSFVRTLNPNTHKLDRSPFWPSYTVKQRNRIVLNEAPQGSDVNVASGSHNEVETEEEVHRCDVIAGLVGEMQN